MFNMSSKKESSRRTHAQHYKSVSSKKSIEKALSRVSHTEDCTIIYKLHGKEYMAFFQECQLFLFNALVHLAQDPRDVAKSFRAWKGKFTDLTDNKVQAIVEYIKIQHRQKYSGNPEGPPGWRPDQIDFWDSVVLFDAHIQDLVLHHLPPPQEPPRSGPSSGGGVSSMGPL